MRAVAFLGLRSHRGLISGQAVIAIWALRLWERVFSVPCFHSFANSFGPGPVLDAGYDLVSWGVKWRPVSEHAPGYTGELVGQGDGELVAMHPC